MMAQQLGPAADHHGSRTRPEDTAMHITVSVLTIRLPKL
jgi:hypothetical protein